MTLPSQHIPERLQTHRDEEAAVLPGGPPSTLCVRLSSGTGLAQRFQSCEQQSPKVRAGLAVSYQVVHLNNIHETAASSYWGLWALTASKAHHYRSSSNPYRALGRKSSVAISTL